MKRFLAVVFLGSMTFGPAPAPVSAAWPWDYFHKQKCHVNLECKQYNAFSPYCCCGVPVDAGDPGHPLLGHPLGAGDGAVTSFQGYAGHLSQLPSPGEAVWDSSAAPPRSGQPGISSATGPDAPNGQTLTPGMPFRGLPSASSPIFNPNGLPFYSPGFLRSEPKSDLGNLGK